MITHYNSDHAASGKNSTIHDDRKSLMRGIYTGLGKAKGFVLKQIKTFVLIWAKGVRWGEARIPCSR